MALTPSTVADRGGAGIGAYAERVRFVRRSRRRLAAAFVVIAVEP
jgi:hypothetical protein